MSQKRKYQILIASALVLFAFLLGTEVPDRWSAMLHLSQEVRQQEADVQSPEELLSRKVELLGRKKLLLASVTRGELSYEQSQTGLVEYLNTCATKAGVRFLTLTPLSSTSRGEMTEINYSFSLQARFSSVGKLLANIEQGPLPSTITTLDTRILNPQSEILKVSVEGKAYIFPGTSS